MKAVLFDLYGTLIDIHTDEESNLFWRKFANKTKKYKKIDYLELKLEYLTLCKKYQESKEEIEILDVFKELFNVDLDISKKIALVFRKLSTEYIKLYKGVIDLLKELKELNIPIYVLSNAQSSFTIKEMKKLSIYDFFNGIAISSDYGIKKPNKEFYKNAIIDFNIADYEIYMVGNDYECDIAPALELGIKTIFISSNLTFNHQEKKDLDSFNKIEIINKIINN